MVLNTDGLMLQIINAIMITTVNRKSFTRYSILYACEGTSYESVKKRTEDICLWRVLEMEVNDLLYCSTTEDDHKIKQSKMTTKCSHSHSSGWFLTQVSAVSTRSCYHVLCMLLNHTYMFCTLVSGTRRSVRPADQSGARQACVRHRRPCLLEQPAWRCSERTNMWRV